MCFEGYYFFFFPIADTPMSFFDFVVDPHSFPRTVENIFHVSFIIRVRFESSLISFMCFKIDTQLIKAFVHYSRTLTGRVGKLKFMACL